MTQSTRFTSPVRRAYGAAIAAGVSLTLALTAPTPAFAAASTLRLSGDSRLDTAAEIAVNTFPGSTRTAIITNADSWADTLAAAPLAGAMGAAQLLTNESTLGSTEDALAQLGVTNVILVGTVRDISGSIETHLAKTYKVSRIAPSTLTEGHYETARLLTEQLVVQTGGTLSPKPKPTATPKPTTKPTSTPSGKAAVQSAESAEGAQGTGANKAKPAPKVSTLPSAKPSTTAKPTSTPTTKPTAGTSGSAPTPVSQPVLPTPPWVPSAKLGNVAGQRTVFIASGESFPDALAGSGAAAAGAIPVLYTHKALLNNQTAAVLKALKPGKIIILGGTATVSPTVELDIRNTVPGASVERLAGQSRVETASQIATWSQTNLGFSKQAVGIARADAFPDAMTAAQYNAKHKVPLVLSLGPDYLTDPSVDFALAQCKTTHQVVAFGGRAAVSDAVLAAMQSAAGCQRPASLPQTKPTTPAPGQPTTKPTTPAKPGTPTTPPPGGPTMPPSTPPEGRADPRTTVIKGTKFLMYPQIGKKIDTTKSGLDDSVSKLSSLYVTGTRDGSPMPSKLDWAQFPCNKVFLDKNGVPVFTDDNKDGFADGFGHSSNDGIEITGMNQVNVPNVKAIRDVAVVQGRSSAQLTSGIADCTWLAAFEKNKDRKIRVDKNGRATTPIGLGWNRIANGPQPGTSQVVITNGNHQYQITPNKTTAKPGQPIAMTVTRKDGKPVTKRLTVATFPCKLVQTGTGDVLMTADKANAASAAGYGVTTTNSAVVTRFNGATVDKPRRLFAANPVGGKYVFEMNAANKDCVAATVIAGNGNGIFDIDLARRPAEPFGVTTVEWK